MEAHGYDAIGNSVIAAFNGVTNVCTANGLNQYASIVCASASPRETAVEYDLDGNMTQCGDWRYTYDASNRLKTVSSNDVLLVTNFYDAKGRRVRKVTSESATTFFYDGWNLIEERISCTNGVSSTVHYYWGKDISGKLQGAGGVGGLLYLTVDGAIYIPCYDHNGNIVLYVSEAGNVAAQYTYDPYGNVVETHGDLASAFHFGFSTQYHDRETGMVGYKRRLYRPDLGRWLNRDPIEEQGGENLYCFCLNDTISKYDAFGYNVTLTTVNRNASWWQVGNRVFHQEICVDAWDWNPKSCCWRRTGRSCYSFAATGFGFGGADGEWLEMDSIKGPGILRGEVYPTKDQGLEDTETLETTPCQDRAFLVYLASFDGREDTYSIGRHSCRTFSQAMMEEEKRRNGINNNGECKNDKKCQ